MLSSFTRNGRIFRSVSAGILLEKGEDRRLTCSYHCWEMHAEQYPGKLGSDDAEAQRVFRILQGKPGTIVGYVKDRIGNTDIALAELKKEFEFKNEFMEMGYRPKALLASEDVTPGDEFLLDSYSIGKQKLKCLGRRAFFSATSVPAGPDVNRQVLPGTADAEGPLRFIEFDQLCCGMNEPIMASELYIRDGACGTVMLRCSMRDENLSPHEVLSRGEVCAMMHFGDIKEKGFLTGDNYYIWADSFDPLIKEGWTVVQTGESVKRKEKFSKYQNIKLTKG
ncbi:hypothetical protein MMC14_008267 [Varicellaria rhodocarpa]|nr:hypothetical protein [Varicellaria rhodocarpa]